MNFKDAMELIEQNIGPETAATLEAGNPEGDRADWGYDSQLVIDLGYSIQRWVERRTNEKAA